MTLAILWTDEAVYTFDKIVEFIENGWGEKPTKKFVKQTEKILKSISHQPYLFKASSLENVRQGYITKQTSFFYEVHSTHLILLFFWDNRQQPIVE